MNTTWLRHGFRALAAFAGLACSAAAASTAADAWTIDFRYAPPDWQTAICLPDDWQKTLVGKSGVLLYDYPGRFGGFGMRISFDVAGGSRWVKQELASPRVPIVRTTKQAEEVEIVEEAFAVPPSALPRRKTPAVPGFAIERIGSTATDTNWARPPKEVDPAFADIALGYGQSVEYRFKAGPADRFTVVFGLCEGWQTNASQRVLDLQIEGRTRRTVDLIAEKGRNVPAVYAFDARDENRDGWVNVSVAAASHSPDQNTILNLLWVFRAGEAPDATELLAGQNPKPPLAKVACGRDTRSLNPPRSDVLLVHLRNTTHRPVSVRPVLTVETASQTSAPTKREARIGRFTAVRFAGGWQEMEHQDSRATFSLAGLVLKPDGGETLAFTVGRGADGQAVFPETVAQAKRARQQAEAYWEHVDLPYGHLQVPDLQVQAQLDSCVRNIYQAREIKKGLPAFQVGPTCYRGLWVVDGSFLLEAMTYLGRTNETRNGVKYLMSFQRDDGGFMLIDGHWKETGIALWAITRHAQLTGDKAWLREVWPKVERGFAHIRAMRRMPPPGAPNEGLIPDGFSDGGLADRVPEYTNIYWTLAGMRAAVEAARWLGETGDAEAWQREYDDFYATFRKAAERDMRTDAGGNRYLPIRMTKGEGIPPQKAQWAFLHALFPGKVFASGDPLVRGNLAMLRAVECQGLVQDTGWLKDGIWSYFASFYGHAWLWLGDGDKAVRTLYAFGNHASPLLCWREEQMPVGKGSQVVGDMPHNWASAEFIRLTRHALALERGNELHLFEAFPAKWAEPGSVTRLRKVLTSFGPMSLEFSVAHDGRHATLRFEPPRRHPAQRVLFHLDHWSGQTGTMELPNDRPISRRITLGVTP